MRMHLASFAIKRLNARHLQLLRELGLHCHSADGITPARLDLLFAIKRAGGVILQSDLLRLIGCAVSTLSRMLGQMMKLEFITVERDPRCRRNHIIRIRPERDDFITQAITKWAAVIAKHFGQILSEDRPATGFDGALLKARSVSIAKLSRFVVAPLRQLLEAVNNARAHFADPAKLELELPEILHGAPMALNVPEPEWAKNLSAVQPRKSFIRVKQDELVVDQDGLVVPRWDASSEEVFKYLTALSVLDERGAPEDAARDEACGGLGRVSRS